ncbi:6-hydroxymethylpterin diphosphokinase MptE-like protein [Haloplanus halobius]|uniref:6-hydroxymethylpterin diphosphokinase MptE-like protein n=1 Tax=Haloplanus halobius TaxID=2934938 RepID=UPI00200F3937|nr:6-hydroxymethylpterin diphosphokinase MptE-like protein [Haloplanus sp. XH21]
MEYQTWNPVYERILDDFGYDRVADERARDRLARYVDAFDESRLDPVAGTTVAVAGAAPCLDDDADVAAAADLVFAASSAAARLRDHGVDVDLMVTDLDKTPGVARELTHEGTPVAVHAHGDNVPELDRWVPRLDGDHVLPTTQTEPKGPVVNYGGFTDGDRAAFLADAFGAAALRFPGWAFDDPTVDPAKRKKLAWAERLLHWLERRRGERFAILDGRRAAIDIL